MPLLSQTNDDMVHAVETGSSPWPWATQREQEMMFRLWAALRPQVSHTHDATTPRSRQDDTAAAGDGERHWVYASRLLSLLQAVMTGRADVTLEFLDDVGRWVLDGPASRLGDRHRGRRAPYARVPPRWGTKSVGEGPGAASVVPQSHAGRVEGQGGPAGDAAAGAAARVAGESKAKAKGAADGPHDGGDDFSDLSDSDGDAGFEDMNLHTLSALTRRNAAKLEAFRAEASARDSHADAGGAGDATATGEGARQPLSMHSLAEHGDTQGDHRAATEATAEDLYNMGIGIVWHPDVLAQMAELRTSRVAVVGAKVTVKDGTGNDAATVVSAVGPIASSTAAAAAEDHTFAPLLCDKSRRIDAKVSRVRASRCGRGCGGSGLWCCAWIG